MVRGDLENLPGPATKKSWAVITAELAADPAAFKDLVSSFDSFPPCALYFDSFPPRALRESAMYFLHQPVCDPFLLLAFKIRLLTNPSHFGGRLSRSDQDRRSSVAPVLQHERVGSSSLVGNPHKTGTG